MPSSDIRNKCAIPSLLSLDTGESSVSKEIALLRSRLIDLVNTLQASPEFHVGRFNHELGIALDDIERLHGLSETELTCFQDELGDIEVLGRKAKLLLDERQSLNDHIMDFHTSVKGADKAMIFDVLTQDIMCHRQTQGIKKKRLEKEKVEILEKWYSHQNQKAYLKEDVLSMLVSETGLTKVQIRNWVSNKRRKQKTSFVSTELTDIFGATSDADVSA